MAGDSGCLVCMRWCCCVYIVVIGILGGLVGLLLAVSGAILLWGTSLLNNLTGDSLKQITNEMQNSMGIEINLESLFNGLSQLMGSVAAVLLIVGIVIVIVSCLGCWGACCGVPACLIVYSVLIGILFLADVVVVIIWFANRNTFKDVVKNSLDSQVTKFRGIRGENVESLVMNVIQIFYGCCGVNNGSDYSRANDWNKTFSVTDENNKTFHFELQYPVTCCKYDTENFKLKDKYCPYNGTDNSEISNAHIGCYHKIFQLTETSFRLDNFFYGFIGWGVFEFLLILGSVLICMAVRRSREPQVGMDYKMQPMA